MVTYFQITRHVMLYCFRIFEGIKNAFNKKIIQSHKANDKNARAVKEKGQMLGVAYKKNNKMSCVKNSLKLTPCEEIANF